MLVGSLPMLGVGLALLSAAVLAVGNLWQSKGVRLASERSSASFFQLLKTPVWLAGSAMFGIAILLQMTSLAFAPLILVQPIGVTALVFTALFTAKASGRRASPQVVKAIAISLIGVTGYVIVAAIVSKQSAISDAQLGYILMTLGAVMLISLLVKLFARGAKPAPISYVILGGTYSSFVATLGKTVMLRVEALLKEHHPTFQPGDWLTIACVLGIGAASALSIYYVQNAHTDNSPEVVIAGLTVIDPAIAVVLGITILHEAAGAPAWAYIAFVVSGAIAFYGVSRLARAESNEPPEQTTHTVERGSQRSAESA